MGLNCKGPLTRGFFSVVNIAVLHDPWLVKSADMEEPLVRESAPLNPTLFMVNCTIVTWARISRAVMCPFLLKSDTQE